MSDIEASAISEVGINPLAQGTKIHAANAISETEINPFARATKEHVANALSEVEIVPLGKLTKKIIFSVVALSSTKIRIVFDRGMLNDSRLIDYLNYTIIPHPSDNGVPLYYTEVQAEDRGEPTYVDIIISEMTDGERYVLLMQSGIDGPVDTEGTPIENSVWVFDGVGIAPEILSVTSMGENRVDVVFSEPMLDNSAIRDEGKYSFNLGLSVLSVLDVDGDTVKLVTSDQDENILYTLTIS